MATAIITGASRGFGRAIASSLAADGWHLVLDARTAADLEAAAHGIDAPAGRIRLVPGDVGDPAHRTELVATAARTGRLDLLVNNAGTLGPTPLPRLADVALDELGATFATNVLAPLGLIQVALPLLEASAGAVVDLTSDAAVEAYGGWGAYGSSKAALDQITNVLGAEHPALRFYAFDPGDMRTRMHQDAFPGEDISDRPLPEALVPALRRLLDLAPPSGRYRAADLLAEAEAR